MKDVKSKAEELYRYLWSRKLKQPYQSVTQRAAEIRLFYFNKGNTKIVIVILIKRHSKRCLLFLGQVSATTLQTPINISFISGHFLRIFDSYNL